VIDVTRGDAKPMRRIPDYAQYMAFFPQLIAGPIIRYHQIDDQIRTPPPRSQRLEDIADGFPRFALGLCKKVLIADQVAPLANAAFADPSGLTTTAAWIGALAFTVQIYFDFSGYSDMAIGLARMFGFRFPENFDRPYSSVSMTDFWRRWHITLSRWFRDYVYIPLGGSRVSQAVTVRNLLIIFLLVGAWHGAAWTFVLWGLYNGVLLVVERLTGLSRMPEERLVVPRRLGTFLLVIFGWVLFRADGLGDAVDVYGAMLWPHSGPLPQALDDALVGPAELALCVGLASALLPRGLVMGRLLDGGWEGWSLRARLAVVALVPLAAITVAAGSFSPFLYFQF
jgi:alginate O-acetyltransferase complex protein AlgI